MIDRSALRFGNLDNFVEISAAVEQDPSLQSDGDARLSIVVQSHGFSGRNHCWTARAALRDFAEQLAQLDRSLKGAAKLESISPGELDLHVRTVSPLGHMVVVGSAARRLRDDYESYLHSVAFGFEIDATQLSAALSNSWLSEYVAWG